jgi:hypothetical protein
MQNFEEPREGGGPKKRFCRFVAHGVSASFAAQIKATGPVITGFTHYKNVP